MNQLAGAVVKFMAKPYYEAFAFSECMKDRYWIIIYFTVGIFFGLFTGAGLIMSWYDEFSMMRFIFVLTGLILLIALILLNMKIGKIVQKL